MLFPLTVLWVSVTLPLAKIPPPLATSPAVLFPLTVLWVSVTCASGEESRRRRRISRGAVSADGALGERHGAIGKNPAAVGEISRGAVSADGALVEREIAGGERADRAAAAC